MHPHRVQQPNLTRNLALTDMPTGLMAGLVDRLELVVSPVITGTSGRDPIFGDHPRMSKHRWDPFCMVGAAFRRPAVGPTVSSCLPGKWDISPGSAVLAEANRH